MKSNITIFITVFALAFASCHENDIVFNTKETDFRTWELSVPIANVHIPLYQSMEKWLKFKDLSINNEGIICAKYTHSNTIKWSDDIGITEVSENWGYDLTDPDIKIIIPNLQFSGTLSKKVELTTKEKGSYVTVAEMKSGILQTTFTIPNNISSCDITISIDEIITSSGESLSRTYKGLTPGAHKIPEIDIANYKIKAVNHILNVIFHITVHSSDQPSSGRVGIDFSVSDMEMYYLKGYFGRIEKNVDDALEFNFFDDLDFIGTIGFKDIEMEAKITNYTGIPTKITSNKINFANENGWSKELKTQKPLDFEVGVAREDANHQIDPEKYVFVTKLDDIEFTAPNFPSKISYDIQGIANPFGESGTNNFVVNDSDHGLAQVDITLTVPFHIRVDAYKRTDNVNFDYKDLIKNDEDLSKSIQYLAVNILVNNDLPFDINLTAFVIDDAGINMENLLHDEIFLANTTRTYEIELNQAQIDNFWNKDAKKITLQTKANTENHDYVKVFANSSLDISISVHLKSSIPVSIFE